MLNFLPRQMESKIFSWLCAVLPVEIVCLINDEVLDYYRRMLCGKMSKMVKDCIRRQEIGQQGGYIILSDYHYEYLKYITMGNCESCGEFNCGDIKNFIKGTYTGLVNESILCRVHWNGQKCKRYKC